MYDSYYEITGQSDALKKTFDYICSKKELISPFFRNTGDIIFVGCGSSYWASLSAHRTFALYTGRRTFAVKAGDVLMNPEEFRTAYNHPILVCPSRSGTTSELLEVIGIFRNAYHDVPVLSITEYENSRLEGISDVCLNISWANEISVCQTRSFSNLYLSMLLISAIAADSKELLEGLRRYVDNAPQLHKKGEEGIRSIADSFQDFDYLVALGSGRQYGVVIEGAYIGIEMALLRASYYTVLELRHGPIVTVNDKTMIAIASNNNAVHLEEKMLKEARSQGAKVLAVTSGNEIQNADWVFSMEGDYPQEAVALYYVYLMQLFAYYQAVRQGLDPDHPGDLIPFITL